MRTITIALAVLAVILGLTMIVGEAQGESCPLAGKRAIDFDCSVTLTVDVMFHAAPNGILSATAKENMPHEKEHAQNVVNAGPGSKAWAYVRNRVQEGRRMVDGKNAKDAGQWLRNWFERRFPWAFIKQHRKAIAGSCVGTGLAAYAIGKAKGESHISAGHDAIEACVSSAAGTAGALAIGGG